MTVYNQCTYVCLQHAIDVAEGQNPRPLSNLWEIRSEMRSVCPQCPSPSPVKSNLYMVVSTDHVHIHKDKMIISIRSAVSVFLEDESFKGKYSNSSRVL